MSVDVDIPVLILNSVKLCMRMLAIAVSSIYAFRICACKIWIGLLMSGFLSAVPAGVQLSRGGGDVGCYTSTIDDLVGACRFHDLSR